MASMESVNLSLREKTLRHVLQAIESTTALEHPFPHLQVREFFPNDVYAQLLANLPAPEGYEPFGYEKHANADGASNRRRFCFEAAWLDKLNAESRGFLYTIRSVLGSNELKSEVFSKLSAGLSYRYSCKPQEARDLPGYALPELFRETEGYQIKPHPDTRKKVVTMQIALPEDESNAAIGTEFYQRSFRPTDWLREPKGFEIVKTMPFVPNVAYAFVVLNTVRLKSWHGRSSLSPTSGVRNSILNIWHEKPEHGNRELVEENRLLAEQQQQVRSNAA